MVSAFQLGFSMTCQPLDLADGPVQRRMASALWWYYFSKFIEFTDTVCLCTVAPFVESIATPHLTITV
jgi:hypothetical protein